MGQRHQIYAFTNQGNFAWHNQWLFGRLPLEQLRRILQYEENTDRKKKGEDYGGYNCLTLGATEMFDVKNALTLIMNTNIEEGTIGNNLDITEEVTEDGHMDFFNEDNNDGITVIDTRKYPIRYCFMFFPWKADHHMKSDEMRPLTAAEYFNRYKSSYTKGGTYNNLMPRVEGCVKFIDDHAKLITLPQLIKIFPESMKEVAQERKKLKATPDSKLATLVGTTPRYQANQSLLESHSYKTYQNPRPFTR